MVLTESTMNLNLGDQAPDFTLPDASTDTVQTLADLKSDIATVIMFICNHCPYVKHIEQSISDCAKKYHGEGIQFIAISSNDVENYPADHPDLMNQLAKELDFCFPYLYDASQEVAKAYDAACTPDFYIFDKDLKCVYRGRYDGSTPGNGVPVTGSDLCSALNSILAGEPVSTEQSPSMGCNIKWIDA